MQKKARFDCPRLEQDFLGQNSTAYGRFLPGKYGSNTLPIFSFFGIPARNISSVDSAMLASLHPKQPQTRIPSILHLIRTTFLLIFIPLGISNQSTAHFARMHRTMNHQLEAIL